MNPLQSSAVGYDELSRAISITTQSPVTWNGSVVSAMRSVARGGMHCYVAVSVTAFGDIGRYIARVAIVNGCKTVRGEDASVPPGENNVWTGAGGNVCHCLLDCNRF